MKGEAYIETGVRCSGNLAQIAGISVECIAVMGEAKIYKKGRLQRTGFFTIYHD